ncbi:hypothetical protein [Neobacillus vireti]|uniref:Uncharacterized protein n=1 Tax=Neobacillus vireti LMG 21834 TaxID=1131730 RepID=A0AB94IUV0_9BACI|nr:hypothetical protein [Neobacillus vireti]ETI70802.1 hypothetical protein BAVI_00345 [Neobacillus vireti LMG 21834]KLT17657.1 hypothetical protein AA980_11095 [Neobacillus vireti]
MKFIYWLIKIALLFVVLYIGDTYLKGLGWWSVLICVAAFILGTRLIDKKIEEYNKQYFLKRLPVLAELKTGQIITIELLNGQKLANRVYMTSLNTEILISAEPILTLGAEELEQAMEKTHWIKLKKVKRLRLRPKI